ncbi:MAG: GDSL-type esterase/lipase family protein, partial [Bacteroidota bacterium]
EPQSVYPALLEKQLQAVSDHEIIVVNAGITGETSKGANERVEWILQQRFDAILLALGTNDVGQRQVLQARCELVEKIRRTNPAALIIGTDTRTAEPRSFMPQKIAQELDVQLVRLPLAETLSATSPPALALTLFQHLAPQLP